ncbi:MAG: SUMF1/EgtB/PvdO family nonheme iron enzyme [Myxococcales bacterium]|nr:SUMF1/EgtB/PvdO family nonheme iron enzyme [Myxococcales bacterium]
MSQRRNRDWPRDEQTLRAAHAPAAGGVPAPAAPVASRTASSGSSGALETPRRIGRHYVVERVIGQGGMGHVVKAVHDLTGQVVAIKTLSPHLAEDPGLRQRFIQEARTLAAFDHPNLIPLYTFLEENGQFFLVMQFIDGQDLDSMFRGTRGLDLSFTVSVFYQTLDGLAYAHRYGVVHRDIKPANILVMQDGRVKLTDFGIARIAGGNRLTKAGVPVGTVFYMAPEQVQGAEAEPRADLYAVGVSLFEVLTGRLPFEGDDYAVRKGHVETPPPDPRMYRSEIPPEMVNIIQKAMAKRPEDRFQTAESFRDALGLIAENMGYQDGLPWDSEDRPTLQEMPAVMVPPAQARSKPTVSPQLTAKSHGALPTEHRKRPERSVVPPQAAGIGPGHPAHPAVSSGSGSYPSARPGYPQQRPAPSPSRAYPTTEGNAPQGAAPLSRSPQPSPKAPLFLSSPPARPTHAAAPSRILTRDGAEMILIRAGSFWMGHGKLDPDARPLRELYLNDYYVDRYPVTNELYQRFISETGYPPPTHWWEPRKHNGLYYPPEQASHPITNIRYEDALVYCQWAGKRLPTEAEWEKACRHTDQRLFPWGDTWQDGRANFGRPSTTPVYQCPQGQSPYGVADLLGNVWEWVADWYAADAYRHIPSKNPRGPAHGQYRIVRGGSHSDRPGTIYVVTRGFRPPELPGSSLGFRCAMDIPDLSTPS